MSESVGSVIAELVSSWMQIYEVPSCRLFLNYGIVNSVVAGVALAEAVVGGRQGDVVMGRPNTARLVDSFATGGA